MKFKNVIDWIRGSNGKNVIAPNVQAHIDKTEARLRTDEAICFPPGLHEAKIRVSVIHEMDMQRKLHHD